jgi:hypothetical protein
MSVCVVPEVRSSGFRRETVLEGDEGGEGGEEAGGLVSGGGGGGGGWLGGGGYSGKLGESFEFLEREVCYASGYFRL